MASYGRGCAAIAGVLFAATVAAEVDEGKWEVSEPGW